MERPDRRPMQRSTRWFLALLALGLGLSFVFVLVGSLATRGTVVSLTEGSVLRIDLSAQWPDSDPDEGVGTLFGLRVVTLSDLVDSIDRAAADDHVAAIELRAGPIGAGWAKATEIRQALLRFRQSGKPVHAWMPYADDRGYYIACTADQIRLLESGTLALDGIAVEVPFYGGTLEKAGLQFDLEQVAEYKNAADSMERKDMSPAHRESVESLVGGLHAELVAGLAESLGRTPEEADGLISGGPYAAERALEAGLVKGLGYEDEAADALDAALGGGRHERIDLEDYVLTRVRPRSGKRIGIVHCAGEIVPGPSQRSLFGGGALGAETIVKAIRRASEKDEVAAIVLRVDSPGGSATASDEIWRAAARARQEHGIPVVVSMADVAASGGYWISMGADRILAQPATITGSIGIYGGKMVTGGLEQKIGLNTVIIQRGANASMDTSQAPYTDAQRALLRGQLESIYRIFLQKTAQGRGFASADAVDAHARGRVWTGRQALERGLVDELGGLREAVAAARRLAKIPDGAPVQLLSYPKPLTFFEMLREQGAGAAVAAGLERAAARRLASELPDDWSEAARLARLKSILEREGVLAWLPLRVPGR